jgi:hypothetical protein
MRSSVKYVIVYCCAVSLLIAMALQLASAQESDGISQADSEQQVVVFDQQQLDQILAPIALYPDSLLSHILIASTYPLEVIQAARWRDAHQDLDQQEVMDAMEVKQWDPSVKALAPFNDLLQTLSQDLDWLENLGNAFLADETSVLASVQGLRQKAYELGNLKNNDYIQVDDDEGEIIIQPVEKEVVYVPYYDTRVVYGPWWHSYPPYYWQRPSHYVWHSGFYWSDSIFISPAFYFGGFHWHDRYTVVDYRWRNNYGQHRYHSPEKVVRNHEYQHWQHNPQHRRGARYVNNHYNQNKMRPLKVVRNQEMHNAKSAALTSSRSGQHNQVVRDSSKVYGENKGYKQDSREVKQKLRQQKDVSQLSKPATNNKMRTLDMSAAYDHSANRKVEHNRDQQRNVPQPMVSSSSAQNAKSYTPSNNQEEHGKAQRYQQSEKNSRPSMPKTVEYKARESRDSGRSNKHEQRSSERHSQSTKHKDR